MTDENKGCGLISNTSNYTNCNCPQNEYKDSTKRNNKEYPIENPSTYKSGILGLCCMDDRDINYSGPENCAPGWCSKTASQDCDIQLKSICDKFDPNKSVEYGLVNVSICQNYCETKPKMTGIVRREDESHYCHKYIADYCSYQIDSYTKSGELNGYCQKAMDINRKDAIYPGYHPEWSDKAMEKKCKDTKFKDNHECSCINSKMDNPECFDKICLTDGYLTNKMLNRQKDLKCPEVCQQQIEINKKKINIDIDNDQFKKTCGINLNSYYDCVKGYCVLSNNGKYKNDNTCDKNCKKIIDTDKEETNTDIYFYISGGILFSILIIFSIKKFV